MDKQLLLKKIIETFGIQNQIDMLHEEMAELIQAINKIKRAGGLQLSNTKFTPPDKNSSVKYSLLYANLCSEVADVKIMIAQIEITLNQDAINLSEIRKLERLSKILNKK